MIQSGRLFGKLTGRLIKVGLPLLKNVTKILGKSFLIPPGLNATKSTGDSGIHKKCLGLGTTKLIISNKKCKI